TYIGNLVQGKYESISYKTSINRPRPKEQWFRVEGTHEPIIDRALWDRVQKMIAQRTKPFKVGTIGLFAKKVRCACCGYIMRSSKSGGRQFLQCPSRYYAEGACEGAFISVDRLERMVIAELRRLNAEYLDMDELERKVQFNADLLEQKQEIEAEIATYQGKINQFSKGVRDLYLDKVKGVISEADFIALSKEFTVQKERLETLLLACQTQMANIDIKIALGDNQRELIEQYVNVEHLTREMVEILIDKIMVGKRIQGTRNVPIEIHWNF
ncbi:MAG: recombinase family protein, partial [Clostridia bacterium]|nr:recombinase family protein [Clostridia bacterium]